MERGTKLGATARKSLGDGSFGVYRAVESSVRSNGSFECISGALMPPDRKFRVLLGLGLVGWASVPEELIEGGAGADRVSDQRFDGGDCLIGVHVQLLADDTGASCSTVDEPRLEVVVHRLSVFTNPEEFIERVGAWCDWAKTAGFENELKVDSLL